MSNIDEALKTIKNMSDEIDNNNRNKSYIIAEQVSKNLKTFKISPDELIKYKFEDNSKWVKMFRTIRKKAKGDDANLIVSDCTVILGFIDNLYEDNKDRVNTRYKYDCQIMLLMY